MLFLFCWCRVFFRGGNSRLTFFVWIPSPFSSLGLRRGFPATLKTFRSSLPLLGAADNQGAQLDTAANIERTDPRRSPQLVAGDTEQVDRDGTEVNRHATSRLDRITVQQWPLGFGQRCQLCRQLRNRLAALSSAASIRAASRRNVEAA